LNDAGLLRSALIAVRLLKIPLTVHVRTVEEARRVKALLQTRPSLDVHVVAISQFIASVLGDTGYDTTVLYDGFSRRGLTAWPKRRDEAPFVITILGRYAISKGQPFVVDALKGGSPDLKGIPWQLRLVGVAQSEEGAALIRRKLGIDEQDKRFLVTGFTERINDVLRDTHVVTIAGVEALGRTWFEAVSAERPILIASGSGSAELANKHGVGVIYGMNSAEDFASKLRWVFNNYKVIQGAVASRKDAILNEYDMAAYVERLMAIILRPAKS
jgi:glycosyltransferase involved in cell wall biosynthesis